MKKSIFLFPVFGLVLSILLFPDYVFDHWFDNDVHDFFRGAYTLIFFLIVAPLATFEWFVIGIFYYKLKKLDCSLKIPFYITMIYCIFVILSLFFVDNTSSFRSLIFFYNFPGSFIFLFDLFFRYNFYRSLLLFVVPINTIVVYFFSSIILQKKRDTKRDLLFAFIILFFVINLFVISTLLL